MPWEVPAILPGIHCPNILNLYLCNQLRKGISMPATSQHHVGLHAWSALPGVTLHIQANHFHLQVVAIPPLIIPEGTIDGAYLGHR